jgi:hypothetical protein
METKHLLLKKVTTLLALMLVISLGWSSAAWAEGPAIWTDKDDYAPGETAYFSGTGWAANDTVDIVIQSTHNGVTYYRTAYANASGSFTDDPTFPILEHHLGEEFLVAAFGSAGGYAEWYFTDGILLIESISEAYISPDNSPGIKDNTEITMLNVSPPTENQSRIRIRQGSLQGNIVFETGNFGLQGEETVTITWNGTRNQNPGSGNYVPDGEYFVIAYKARGQGEENLTEGEYKIVTVDNTNPVINLPANITVNNDQGACGGTVSWEEPTVTDANPDPNGLEQIAGPTSGSLFPIGTTTVTYKATDLAGNNSTASFTVTVNDSEAPVIADMPEDITQGSDAGECGAIVEWDEPTADDNCGVESFTSTHNPGDFFPVGTTTVTYTAEDAAGNVTTESFDITVEDVEPPVIAGMPEDITQGSDAGECGAIVEWDEPTADDNCGVESFTSTHNPGDFFPVGTTTVTYTAEDAAGNVTTESFDITVEDVEPPVIAGMPEDITQGSDAGECGAIVEWDEPTADDNCGVESFTSTHNPGDFFPVGTTTVTYTAEDAAGNVTTESFDITVEDVEPPVIAGMPEDITQGSDAGECGAIVEWDEPTADDNCGVESFTSTHNPGDFFPVGTTTVTYTAEDAAGNVTTESFDITVEDVEPPVIAGMPEDITQGSDAGECGAIVEWDEPTADDNCGVESFTSTHNPGDFFPVGTTTVTYTAEDAAGNVTTESFDITVEDVEPPVIAGMPEDITQGSDAGECGAIVEWDEPTADDNCGVESFTSTHNPGDFFPVGTTTVTYTAEDAAGNVTTESFDITVEDVEPPVIAGMPEDITQGSDAGECGAIVEWDEPTADDNCGVESFTSTHNPGDFFPVGTTTVTYTAEDAAGNVTTESFDITVEDVEPPVIAGMPEDITQGSDAGECGAIVEWDEPTADDNCGVESFTSTHNPGDFFPVGTTTVTYTAEDAAGNVTTESFDITVEDVEPPVIAGMPEDITQGSDAGECGAIVEWDEPTADDNCGVESFTSTHNPGDFFPVGTTTVTYTAEDAAGNVTTESFDITVEDVEPPVIAGMPEDITQGSDAGECGAIVEWDEPTADDNCGVESFTSTHNPGDFFPVGTTTVTYTAEDAAGNVTTESFDITVEDVEPPVIAGMPEDITQGSDAGECGAIVEWDEPTADDNCGVESFTSTHNPGDFFPVGTTTVTYTAEDAAGNVTTESFDITVEDVEPPVIAGMPEDITQGSDAGECGAIVEWDEPTADDNCGVESFTSTHNPGDFFPVGTTTVTYTAEDAAGNVTTESFDITVEDVEPPVIAGMPEDITQGSDAGECGAIVEWDEPTADDNCGVESFTSTHNPGDFFPVGTTTVTYTAEDAAGNVTTESFDITVEDVEPPVIAGMPEDITQGSDAGECGAIVEWDEPTADDNCGVESFTSTHNPGDFFPVGTTTVTYTAEDAAGNVTTESFDITVEDVEPPVIAGMPEDITQGSDAGECGAIVEWDEPTADDNCGVESFTSTHNPGDFFPVGTTTVTYTAEDAAGNVTTESFDITVEDVEPPVIAGMPEDITQGSDAGECGAIVEWDEPTADDNCGVESFTSTHNPGDFFPVGTTTVTYTAEDAAGNVTTESFDITVEDVEPPVIAGMPEDITQGSDAGECGAIVEWDEPTADDNCGVESFTSTHNPGDFFPVGTTTVTYTAEDAAGNVTTESFDITVEDVEPPVIAGMPEDIVDNNALAACDTDIILEATTLAYSETEVVISEQEFIAAGGEATDNCGIAYFGYFDSQEGECPIVVTRTFIVRDASGNEDTAVQMIEILPGAELEYTGSRLAAANNNGDAVINLRAMIVDVDECGSITTATVKFNLYESLEAETPAYSTDYLPINNASQNDPNVAFAGADLTVNIGSSLSKTFYVEVVAGGCYQGVTDARELIQVYRPSGDHVTGGGFIQSNNSQGQYPAAQGSNTNFGFNVRFHPKQGTLQGDINLIIRGQSNPPMQFNSTTPLALGINSAESTAQFAFRGNLTQANQVLAENVVLQVTMQDNGNPGTKDLIGFTIWDGNTLIYSSDWNGSTTGRINLSGGNLVIHRGGTDAEPGIIEIIAPGFVDNASERIETGLQYSVFPNPFRERLNFRFVPEHDTRAVLELYDMNGALIQTLFDDAVSGGQQYEVEYLPQLRQTGMVFYRLVMGNKVSTGRVLYQR